MPEITLDDINRAITLLKMRAAAQAELLASTTDLMFAKELRPAHTNLVQNIYRMMLIRDGLVINEPSGLLH